MTVYTDSEGKTIGKTTTKQERRNIEKELKVKGTVFTKKKLKTGYKKFFDQRPQKRRGTHFHQKKDISVSYPR